MEEKIIKEINNNLIILVEAFERSERDFNYVLAYEKHYLSEIIDLVKKLTTTDVSQQSEVLPEFLTKDSYGKIVTAYIGGADVTKEWNEYLSSCR